MATYDVAGRSAIVTGAGSGIGHATAVELARSGASVLACDINADAAATVVEAIRAAGGTAEAFVGDVSDPAVSEAGIAAANALAPLRIAVNNAGIGAPAATIGDHSIDDWHRVLDVNLNAVFYGLKYQLPAIAANGGGAIVNMASVLSVAGLALSSANVTAKHAIVGLTKNAALEYGAQNVRVNAVGAGFINTPFVIAHMDAATTASVVGKQSIERLGDPEEVAALVAFLASDAASFITGSFHLVDGGYAAQ